jgi:hypothetical protein
MFEIESNNILEEAKKEYSFIQVLLYAKIIFMF